MSNFAYKSEFRHDLLDSAVPFHSVELIVDPSVSPDPEAAKQGSTTARKQPVASFIYTRCRIWWRCGSWISYFWYFLRCKLKYEYLGDDQLRCAWISKSVKCSSEFDFVKLKCRLWSQTKYKPMDILLMSLTVFKHGGPRNFLGQTFEIKRPTFQRLITGFVTKPSKKLHDIFVADVANCCTRDEIKVQKKKF